MTRKVCFSLLAILLLITAAGFSSCTEDDGVSNTVSNVVSQDVSEGGRGSVSDGLPDVDFGGRTYTVMCRSEREYEFSADEQNNEYINDTIYERNKTVEERFGVTIETQTTLGEWGQHEEFMNVVRNQIRGNTAKFDIIAGYAAIIPTVVGDDLFYSWYDIEYVDESREWWSEDLVNELTINGKMYLLAGDIALTLWQSMQGIFYNINIAKDGDVGNLYQLVYDGDWTFDEMTRIAKKVTRNEGDAAWTEDDYYGYVTARTTQIDVYLDAFGIPVTTKNNDGYPEFTVNQEKTYTALNMLYDFICVPGNGAFYGDMISPDDSLELFSRGHALFCPSALSGGEMLRNYDVEYGILPNPKYEEDQDGYYTTCQDYFSIMAVPVTCNDTEFVGMITEALAAESYRSVVEDYYEVILKSRYTYDDDSAKMIDIIRQGLRFNFGYLYSYAMDWPAHQLNICINANSTDFASTWAQKEEQFNINLQEQLEAYR